MRRSSFSGKSILWDKHVQWLEERLASRDCSLFIAENAEGEPIGQIRFDRVNDVFEVDVSVAAAHRGEGIAHRIIEEGVGWLIRRHGEALTVRASVKAWNKPSLAAFVRAGFVRIGEESHGGEDRVLLEQSRAAGHAIRMRSDPAR